MRIHMESLLFEVILNIALLVLVATLLSKVQLIQTIISQERRSGAGQVFLSVVFGAVIVLSVYTGIDMDGYNMNTRVIAAIAAGILGGPLVGMYASMIGAVYIYFFAGPAAFAMASAFSTVLFGLLGGILPVFPAWKMEIQRPVFPDLLCGDLRSCDYSADSQSFFPGSCHRAKGRNPDDVDECGGYSPFHL